MATTYAYFLTLFSKPRLLDGREKAIVFGIGFFFSLSDEHFPYPTKFNAFADDELNVRSSNEKLFEKVESPSERKKMLFSSSFSFSHNI